MQLRSGLFAFMRKILTLMEKKSELFVVGWEKDDQPKAKVRSEIMRIVRFPGTINALMRELRNNKNKNKNTPSSNHT